MKHTTNNKSSNLRIVGRGVAQLRNGESAEAGISSTLINMRERESALEVVGRPRQLQQLTSGDRVLLVDGDRTLVLRDGQVVWSDMVVLDTSATVIAAHKVGNLLVVVTARKGTISYKTALDRLPDELTKYFSGTNLMIIFPDQYGNTKEEKMSFTEAQHHEENSIYDTLLNWLQKKRS